MARLRGASPLPRRKRPTGSTTQLRHVLRGGALLSLNDVKLDLLAIGERLESVALDGRVMDEAILRAALGCDETKALRVVEPLYCANCACHLSYSMKKCCVRSPGMPHSPTQRAS